MDQRVMEKIIEQVVQRLLHKDKPGTIPIAVSARHVHLSQDHVETLFGPGYQLSIKSELSQPEQYAAQESIMVVGPKGCLEQVRILGPSRKLTQVEISQTDAIKLGLHAPLRLSGNIHNSSSCTLVGPKGSIYLQEGVIIAKRHIHMSPEDAIEFGVTDGEIVEIKAISSRPITFDDVVVRVSDRYRLEMHIDTDEANAGLITTGCSGVLKKKITSTQLHGQSNHPSNDQSQAKTSMDPGFLSQLHQDELTKESTETTYTNNLLSEKDVHKINTSILILNKHTIVTPLARDLAKEKGIELQVKEQ